MPALSVPDAPPPRGNAGRGMRPGHAVVAAAAMPPDAPSQPLPQAVAALFAERCSSATAAKRACRRGEVLVEGVQRGVTWHAPMALPYTTLPYTPAPAVQNKCCIRGATPYAGVAKSCSRACNAARCGGTHCAGRMS